MSSLINLVASSGFRKEAWDINWCLTNSGAGSHYQAIRKTIGRLRAKTRHELKRVLGVMLCRDSSGWGSRAIYCGIRWTLSCKAVSDLEPGKTKTPRPSHIVCSSFCASRETVFGWGRNQGTVTTRQSNLSHQFDITCGEVDTADTASGYLHTS